MQKYKKLKHALNENKSIKVKILENGIYKIININNLPTDTP